MVLKLFQTGYVGQSRSWDTIEETANFFCFALNCKVTQLLDKLLRPKKHAFLHCAETFAKICDKYDGKVLGL